MIELNKVGNFEDLSNYIEVLNYVMYVNKPHTNIGRPHVMHKTPTK